MLLRYLVAGAKLQGRAFAWTQVSVRTAWFQKHARQQVRKPVDHMCGFAQLAFARAETTMR